MKKIKNSQTAKTSKSVNATKRQRCSICGKLFKGIGKSAHPVTDGLCCNMCHGSIVMPSRGLTAKLSEIKESEVIEFSSRRFKGVSFDYVKSLQVLTDYKGIFIRNFPAEELDNAVKIFEDIYLSFTSLICDYNNIGKHMEQLLEVDILKELEFENVECGDSEIDLDKIFDNL